ncbi:unnamed protein product [Paramecium pentaurelia]|uniref:LITAF domain-containing protein n=1 Tax=Paramecium pentaurelia TaxID=43138 RepID=A0A8S1URD6_9CILI|nr:unnamed protein product [Paramecium pentaurelia]
MLKNSQISCYSLQKSGESQTTQDTYNNTYKGQKKSVLLILNQSQLIDQPLEVQSMFIFPSSADDSRTPIFIDCPACRQKSETLIAYQNGNYTFICALLLLLLCFPIAFLPFCKNDCKDVIQHCSKCAATVGQAQFKPFRS